MGDVNDLKARCEEFLRNFKDNNDNDKYMNKILYFQMFCMTFICPRDNHSNS